MILSLDNIRQGQENNFQKLHLSRINSLGTPYDAVSVMHYHEYAFSDNGRKTIESKHGIPLGGPELSPTDVKQARLLYRCPTGDWSGVHCTLYLYIKMVYYNNGNSQFDIYESMLCMYLNMTMTIAEFQL